MWDQRLFTELKKVYPFPRTDVAKLGSTRKIGGFSVNLYREIRKIFIFRNVKNLITL